MTGSNQNEHAVNATLRLAEFAAGLSFETIPKPVVEHVKLCILDGIGVCLHGAALPWTRMVQDMVAAEGAKVLAGGPKSITRKYWVLVLGVAVGSPAPLQRAVPAAAEMAAAAVAPGWAAASSSPAMRRER